MPPASHSYTRPPKRPYSAVLSSGGLAALTLALSILVPPPEVSAQAPATEATVDPARFGNLSYRMVGPYRGGRSTAVTGIADQPTSYYMGTTGGGVWKTEDDGTTWTNISDGFFGGSIGAVDVADSDPNVVYVGMGSVDIRGNTSVGRGMWRSTDAGKTWTSLGLEDAGQIGRIEVHPDDPDLVYVAALGHAFGKNGTRGIFRSADGGETWEHVLFLNDSTGASDLTLNPLNPRELYAGMWRGERKPWALISGGPEGGVYKTTDGGDTWTKLGGGLPEGVVGKVGVSVSPAMAGRVWAIIEAEPDGGVYRSDDGGATWTRTNSENNLRQRAWYYTHVQADPQDENTVYALNTGLYRSVDGGRTFEGIAVPHGDIHWTFVDQSRQPPPHGRGRRRWRTGHGERGCELDHLLQPTDRGALRRHRRQRLPVPPVRGTTGQHDHQRSSVDGLEHALSEGALGEHRRL